MNSSFLYSSVGNSDSGLSDHLKTRLQVVQEGRVTWPDRREITVTCDMNFKYFPFDTQICRLVFGSWWHPAREIDLQLDYEDVNMGKKLQDVS